ncbi:WD40-repeat-containing domain protein [Collybia nuda]|uniref:WD40-repeat-containing domain protein n=1 Tax=Collybia nuda TaxID=64659 RepID=A0A9P5XW05_9AGAR|nr:WD40-repeat-containing domain protein [Collybia nuda]
MSSTNKPKKGRTKPPQGRPVSSSAISQPSVEDASHLTTLSSFSPSGAHFALLSLAVDKHRLRVYNTSTGKSVAEQNPDSARVSALTWGTFILPEGHDIPFNDVGPSPSKKKRKKRNSLVTDVPQIKGIEVVVLGLSDGTILIFSPTHDRTLRTLSYSTSTAEILSVAATQSPEGFSLIWASSADGTIRLWNANKNNELGSWKTDDRIPYASMAARPMDQDYTDLLVAHHGIRLPTQLASFTGHATTIKTLQWDASQIPSTRFLSLAEADRFLYIWEVSEGSSTEGKPIASIPLDSDARRFSLSNPQRSSMTERQTLLTLSASGKIMLLPIPRELSPSLSSNQTQHKIPTLLPRSNITISSKNSDRARVIDVTFSEGDEGSIQVATIVGGVHPVFNVIRYLDASGEFIKDITIEGALEEATTKPIAAIATRRYAESSSLTVGSGVELGQDEEMDDFAARNIEGDLDVDLAELSLGQRLTAISGVDTRPSSDSDNEALKERETLQKTPNEVTIVPTNSLTRTLIQALHSSDSRLLETCLAHSDQALIRNTVRRLPPQLAVPLITACVERLGRGARAGNIKGGGGGASSQRGTGLIMWVKITLAVHSGHLMTIPDLVARLSGLHATLTSRLNLQESLLSLGGRLDMVLSQIEMRSSITPAPLALRKNTSSSKLEKKVVRYIEGESEGDTDGDEQMEVEVESGDEEGSVEDVELGGESDEDDETSGDDDEGDDSEGPTMNGFIDDEADEYSEEEDESE